jgi:flagellar basal body-associated protein FliL
LFNSNARIKNQDHLESNKHQFSSDEHFSAEQKKLHRKHQHNMLYIILVGVVACVVLFYFFYHSEVLKTQIKHQENKIHAVIQSGYSDIREVL